MKPGRPRWRAPSSGKGYAAWLRALRGRSGFYFLRRLGGEVIAGGESSSGRLYQEIIRWFQKRGARRLLRPSSVEVRVVLRHD